MKIEAENYAEQSGLPDYVGYWLFGLNSTTELRQSLLLNPEKLDSLSSKNPSTLDDIFKELI